MAVEHWPPSPFIWPFLLMAALLGGIVTSLLCLRSDVLRERYRVEPAALAEASIAICSGALLWIGWWDFIDSYLVPTAWWAKLCMLCVGAIGALFTRSLYADQAVPRHSIRAVEGTSVCVEDDEHDEPPAQPDGPPPLVAVLSPRPVSLGQSEDDMSDLELQMPRVRGTPGYTPGRVTRGKTARRAGGARASREGGGPEGGGLCDACPAACSRFCFLNPPRFSASRCARALLATFSGLTMWVGLWDLIETHLLPTLFTSCSHEPSSGCAAVKLSLVFIGAFGLYVTRSLYGDHGVGAVQFQRL